ncbi:MAG: hypothetical protein AAGI91_07095 [Bacteroidota bacterium]
METPAADLRALQIVWKALVGGVALMTVVLGGLTAIGYGQVVGGNAATFFYVNAAINFAAVLGAFAVQRRLIDAKLPATGTPAEAVAEIRSSGVLSLAFLEGSALVAGVSAFFTGEAVNLLFVVPFFGFAAVFYPTAARVEALLSFARGG